LNDKFSELFAENKHELLVFKLLFLQYASL